MLYSGMKKRAITFMILVALLMCILSAGVGCTSGDNRTDTGDVQTENERSSDESSSFVTDSSVAIQASKQEAANLGYQVFVTDFFTIEVPDGWSAETEPSGSTFLLSLKNEAGSMAGSIEVLPQGATVMPLIPSDSHKQVLHEDDEIGQKTIITVFCTNKIGPQKAAIIAEIMEDSLKNTAAFDNKK